LSASSSGYFPRFPHQTDFSIVGAHFGTGMKMATTTNAAPPSYWPAKGLTAILDFAARSHARAAVILVAVALLAFTPGFFQIPPVDRDEARFAQATKQMIETGDYIDIRFQDEVRYKKPVGIYWLQAAVVKSAGALGLPDALTTIWLYRIPSLIGAVGAVLLTYWCALAFVSGRGAVLAALMMAGSILLGVEARLAKTDAMLLLTVLAAMGALARVYLALRRNAAIADGWTLPAIFWTALAGGILLKGPLIVLFVGLAAATLCIVDRSARWLLALRPLAGVLWTVLLVMPWFVAIYLRAGSGFLLGSVGEDLLAKITSPQEAHGAPPGTYIALFFATFWPASMLAGLAAPAVWKVRREPAARFLLCWLVPSWIVFELVVTKLPHYVLPLYPAIAILIAGAVETRVLSRRPWLVRASMWWFLVPALASIAVVVAAVIVDRQLGLPAWPFLAAAIIFGLLAWQLYEADGPERAFLRATAAAILLAIGTYALIVPGLGALFPSVALANVLRASNCERPVAASVGYEEPSLVFLAGTSTRLTDASSAADFLRQGGSCHFAFIEARHERAFANRAEAIGLRYERGPRLEAINMSAGRPVTVAVFRSRGAP
jgi:4-amino-4-deoxy-L-arabinose transferase-like glycosyltransferase